jgi:hypothetical protein
VNGEELAKDFSKKLAGQIGEHLVVAELGRRGIIAAPFAGNVPDIDILAYANGLAVPIQVKAMRQPSGSVDASKFLSIRFDGERQIIDGFSEGIDRNLIYVLVHVGETRMQDRFFVLQQGELQDLILHNHSNVLLKFGGRRPKNWESTHCSYDPRDIVGAEENWALIAQRLGMH